MTCNLDIFNSFIFLLLSVSYYKKHFCEFVISPQGTALSALSRSPCSPLTRDELNAYPLSRTHPALDACHSLHISCQSSLAKEHSEKTSFKHKTRLKYFKLGDGLHFRDRAGFNRIYQSHLIIHRTHNKTKNRVTRTQAK